MQRTALVLLALLSGCWRSAPTVTPLRPVSAQQATQVAPKPEASYRHVTIAIDAISIGLIAASTAAYSQRGGDDPLAVGLLLVGGLTMAGAPIVHATHGKWQRAGASHLFRAIFVTAGMVAGMEVGCARDPGFLCGIGPEMGWGVVGGLVVASAFDALLLHNFNSTWTPTVTPSEDGARVGIARTF